VTSLPLEDVWLPLDTTDPVTCQVRLGVAAVEAVAPFDYDHQRPPSFEPWSLPDLPDNFGVGLIVGASGTGKSTLLHHFGLPTRVDWDSRSIADHFGDGDRARQAFYSAGLSSVPTWLKPFSVLSNGERFRAHMARVIDAGSGVVDEFTSVIDRTVAASASRSLRRHVDISHAGPYVLATCHRDVIPWLRPDWIIDTDGGVYCLRPRECLQREPLVAEIYEADRTLWKHFMGHHYLTESLHPFARCYVATVGALPAAFGAAIPFPHGSISKAWRGTRTVTLPDYQGIGIGVRLSNWIAEAHVRGGYRYFSRTTHPRMGAYREGSALWRATSSNLKRQTNAGTGFRTDHRYDASRVAYSHEFILNDLGVRP
jgi:GNAT superfamily N-acetyltransferase